MDTSSYNASLQQGEKPVGSGAGVPAKTDAPGGTRFSSVHDWKASMARRGPANIDVSREVDEINRRIEEDVERQLSEEPSGALTPDPETKPNYDIDPALADPWDLTPEQRAARLAPEGFEKYRQQQYRGHTITPPDAVLVNTKVEVEEVHAAAADVGIAARRDGVSAEGAQAMFDVIAEGYQPPKTTFDGSGEEIAGTFDYDTAMQQMNAACGENTQDVLADLRAWVGKRPAVAAFLDEGVQFGNHPGVLLTIGAIAQAAKQGLDLTKVSDAKVYVERMMSDPKSPYWLEGPMHKLTVQGVQFALAVEESSKKKAKR
jgi:hypothetical protein